MRTIFFIIFIFCVNNAHSQVYNSSITNLNIENSSDVALLNEAKYFSSIDQQASIQLANKTLYISAQNHNFPITAQAHILLGDIAYDSNNIDLSLHHFLEAALVYKKINDNQNYIKCLINYIDILLDDKRYEKAEQKVNELLLIALKHQDELLIALTFIAKGDGYYQQKHYNKAILEYIKATKYLSGTDQVVQKHLGETYKIIAQSYKRLKNREKTAYFYKKTLDVFTVLKNKKLIARTLNTLAEAERYLGHLVIALEYSIRGLEIHKEINDPIGRMKSLVAAGIIYRHIGRYEKSLKHIYEAHLYYKKINDLNRIAATSNQLGYVYSRLNQFDMAKSHYKLSIDLSNKQIKKEIMASSLRELAVINLNVGDYEGAMAMALQSHAIYKDENDKLKASRTARVIASIYRAQDNSAKAIEYYKEALDLATKIDNKIYQIKAQTALGGVLLDINVKEAIRWLNKSLELSKNINNKQQMLYVYRNLRKAEKIQGNIANSLLYAEEEIALTEVIQKENDEKNVNLEKANVYSYKMEMELSALREKAKRDQFELSRKNNEIEIAKQTRIINELELTKNKYASFILSLLLMICVLLVILIYRRFIVSKKRNRELDYLAARDPLTNCYNRRILFNTYGHNAGDIVLTAVANILKVCVRQNDIVARFGGEEFCVVLPGASTVKAMKLAEKMREKIENSQFDDISVTCSFGVTSIKFNAKNPSELIEQADLALFKSKSLGRNQITLWSEALNEESL